MKKILQIITCIPLVLLLGCSSISENNSDNISENITFRVFTDYAVYSDIYGLSEHSDFVIEGIVMSSRVEKIDTTIYHIDGVAIQKIEDEKINFQYISRIENSQRPEPHIRPYTVYTVKVTEVYKGYVSENELIDVAILGGELSGQMWISETDVLLEDTKTYFLFLKSNQFFPYAFLTSPLQGSYEVLISNDNGVVSKEIIKLNKDNLLKIDLTDIFKILK